MERFVWWSFGGQNCKSPADNASTTQYLCGEEKEPHDFMAKVGSARSSSKISRDALVLKVASSCWADVPEHIHQRDTLDKTDRNEAVRD